MRERMVSGSNQDTSCVRLLIGFGEVWRRGGGALTYAEGCRKRPDRMSASQASTSPFCSVKFIILSLFGFTAYVGLHAERKKAERFGSRRPNSGASHLRGNGRVRSRDCFF